MSNAESFVIVGAGLAGAKTAEALRTQGFRGRIVLIGDEPHSPYERPPLSKGYLLGDRDRDTVFVHPREWYDQHAVELRTGSTVTALDRGRQVVELADGATVRYDRLLLATGASPRKLAIPGADATGVHTLRSLDDCDQLRSMLVTSQRIAVIGAGWIGLEVASAARQAGVEVTVIESLSLPLLRVLGTEVAQVFATLHRDHDVDFRFEASVEAIWVRNGRATGVDLGAGGSVAADAVLVAVGVAPNVALAAEAGLEIDNGILVDASLRTGDPNVFAVGDVASAYHPFYDRHIRVEHWANALNQPATAAAAMTAGDTASRAPHYDALPYFFTDQYDLGMEYVGHAVPGGYDEVVLRGDVHAREFVAFWLHDDRVVAGMNVNVWDVTDAVKALITSRVRVDTGRLADPTTPLANLVG